MKTLDFFYQEYQIHFALQNDGNVMINATEMAKAFNKRTSNYLANEATKQLIKELELTEIPANSDLKILDNRGHAGYYFHELLALDFAAWLDVSFRLWIYKTIRNVAFGNYKKHWEAHQEQLKAQNERDLLKLQLLSDPTPEIASKYFDAEAKIKSCLKAKKKAITDQYKLEL